MASSQEDDDWDDWDKSTSEVQSEDSDELFENRPNRWRGPPQSWRTITEEDRLTYNALQRLRNQDLSVHLYNAFALRQTPQLALALAQVDADAGAGSDIDAGTGRPVRREPWAPPKGWTAWPLGAHLVPPDDFMKKTEDEDEAFTFRRLQRETPSSKLEEVISANVLKFAKEKFSKRHLSETPPSSASAKVKPEPLSSGDESPTSEAESEDGGEMDLDGASGDQPQLKTRPPVRTFKPVVATDDDVSYGLIRPSARSILEKLDKTLSILHNSRMTSAQNLMDSAESSSEDDDEEMHRSRRTSRASSGRARSRRISRTSTKGGETTQTAEVKKTNRGRPPKYVQKEGESEHDFLLRRAKAQKKKLPGHLDSEDENGETTAAEGQKSPRKRRRGRVRRRESMTEDREYWIQKKLERFNLRDWSDVMGAAALAGFSPEVIARATQRCANLFGQGMEMHTVNETVALSGETGIKTTRYEPGNAVPPSSSESGSEHEDLDIRQARSISRHSGVVPSKAASPVLSDEEDEGGESPKKRQQRSSSRGAATGQHYCPHADCSRALKGFSRLFNLKRHLKLVHGGDSVEDVKATPMEDDGLERGVHHDGFLEPVRIQKGWRTEDIRKRAKKKIAKKRQRHDSSGEDDESGSEDSDSEESETGSER
ncbi:hypothetical protein VP1G_09159 [Cytospora mali]|uniref:Rrn9 domain-containing protein n=1 Tax=Cytospora mali TaxID=578113 RepID=A0A194VDE5_CYTMA|nr:hypothetical protein VP1G_09159 [Valsa mali var. pyri (nom. inval.)]